MRVPRVPALVLAALAPLAAAAADEPAYPHGTFTGDCTTCHDAERWKPAKIAKSFAHPSRFPLRGAHATVACRDCHLDLDFTQAPKACADCHKDPHLGELGTDCVRCHTERNFLDRSSQLELHRLTRFPLTGAHAAEECEACHKPQPQGALKWVNTPVDCQACHLARYEATTAPNHAQIGFPTDCAMCHRPTAWELAKFDHALTGFPLTGAHRTVPCQSCHAGSQGPPPTACYGCHKADYDGTTDPSHTGAAFPTDCTLCHTTTTWQGAVFTQHDSLYFPIYSGSHNGRWTACTDCHNNPSSYAAFTCLTCHDKTTTDSHHTGVTGYVYDSNACYSCHPRGSSN